MATERYFVGPSLLSDIRQTIATVNGTPTRVAGGGVPGQFSPLFQPGDGGFHMATFTGSWGTVSPVMTKTVTLYNAASTAETLVATNLLINIPELSTDPENPTICAIGEDRGVWYLLNVLHSDADVLTDVTLEPTQLEFSRKKLASISATVETTAIVITECDNESASAEQLNWFFG